MSARTLQYKGHTLTYQIKRSARCSIGLKISHQDGLVVTLPNRLALAEAERALLQKIDWILAKLAHVQSVPAAPNALVDGAHWLWLGEAKTLQLNSGRTRIEGGIVHLAVPAKTEAIAHALKQVCQRAARFHFAERVEYWSAEMALLPQKWALSSARGRWGSCTSAGGLRLNWRLMQAPREVIDYVVIHELAHLAEMNHSPRFWAIVAAHCPDWKVHRSWLKLHGTQLMAW